MKKISIFYFAIFLAIVFFATVFFLTKDKTKEISIENSAPSQLEKNQPLPISLEQELETTTPEKNEAERPAKEKTDVANQEKTTGEISTDLEKKNPDNPEFIKQSLVSWGFTPVSQRKIDTIIVHSSYDALGKEPYDVDGILEEYKQYGVSAHYLIDRSGNVYQLVKNNNIAYHAGASSVPDGRTNVNDFSIGIELVNTKTDKYTSPQYESLNKLIEVLSKQYKIKYVLGHDEIAPGRKDDPWNFDWKKIDAR